MLTWISRLFSKNWTWRCIGMDWSHTIPLALMACEKTGSGAGALVVLTSVIESMMGSTCRNDGFLVVRRLSVKMRHMRLNSWAD